MDKKNEKLVSITNFAIVKLQQPSQLPFLLFFYPYKQSIKVRLTAVILSSNSQRSAIFKTQIWYAEQVMAQMSKGIAPEGVLLI